MIGIIAIAALIAIGILLFQIRTRDSEIKKNYEKFGLLNKERSSLTTTLDLLNKDNIVLTSKLNQLSKYQTIVDVEEEAIRIRNDANSYSASNLQYANDLKTKTEKEMRIAASMIEAEIQRNNEELNKLRQIAKNEIKEILENSNNEASSRIASAFNQSNKIIEKAKEEAKTIAGEAYEVLENVNYYKELLKSITNTIEGYDDKYIVPMQSYIDELAENFGYTEAGDALKSAREATRKLVQSNKVGECDYVERERKEASIRFAVDAFNGKVDSILTEMKSDNFGTIEQKIKDAFALINYLGRPFKNARITDIYLKARINEAHWGCMAVELRNREKEEQRRIREQIKEEEKAQKEIEKALKEAEKEEDYYRKAIEKANEQLSKASEVQKLKYEQQLADLQAKLITAEEKGQRALSRAQQTRSGHVYVISNIGSFGENVYKIGMTRRLDPEDRVKELGDASVPFPFDIHAMIYTEDAPSLENELHKVFNDSQVNKVNAKKEFFKVGLKDVRQVVEEKKLNSHWTMLAEATEYRETLAIEKGIKESKNTNQLVGELQNNTFLN